MLSLQIKLPDSILATFHQTSQELSQELLLMAVAKWYELGKLSQGKAAEIMGLSREEFLLVISRLHISPFQYTADDLVEELRDAD
jgi:predicted HTH domain antitoxin